MKNHTTIHKLASIFRLSSQCAHTTLTTILTFGIIMALTPGCSPQSPSLPNEPTTTNESPSDSPVGKTKAELVAVKGEPIQEKQKLSDPTVTQLTFGDQEVCEMKEAEVTICYRSPIGNESLYQYWLQRWNGLKKVESVDESLGHSHGRANLRIFAPERQEAITYSPGLQSVLRVYRYE